MEVTSHCVITLREYFSFFFTIKMNRYLSIRRYLRKFAYISVFRVIASFFSSSFPLSQCLPLPIHCRCIALPLPIEIIAWFSIRIRIIHCIPLWHMPVARISELRIWTRIRQFDGDERMALCQFRFIRTARHHILHHCCLSHTWK